MESVNNYIYQKRIDYSNADGAVIERLREQYKSLPLEQQKRAKKVFDLMNAMRSLSGTTNLTLLNDYHTQAKRAINDLFFLSRSKKMEIEMKERMVFNESLISINKAIAKEKLDKLIAEKVGEQLASDKYKSQTSPIKNSNTKEIEPFVSQEPTDKNNVDDSLEESFFEKNKMAIIGVGAVVLIIVARRFFKGKK